MGVPSAPLRHLRNTDRPYCSNSVVHIIGASATNVFFYSFPIGFRLAVFVAAHVTYASFVEKLMSKKGVHADDVSRDAEYENRERAYAGSGVAALPKDFKGLFQCHDGDNGRSFPQD
ncbi:hypothetical protein XENOCAPTIV_024683 [Xenoophorus captivus]|uniref:Uncharacterized protein n=1 Tax=Xenoophorus captivus TaxID=1517983 RepID=A0ABV0R2U2_9TELE